MPRPLDYTDHREDPGAWAQSLGIPQEAVDLYLECDVVDPHTCSFMWTRLLPGYDVRKRHRPVLPGSYGLNQVDLPRAREARMAAIVWDIPTNPFRSQKSRPETALRNIQRIVDVMSEYPEDFRVVRSYSEYEAARKADCTASFIGIQGAQGLDDSIEQLDRIPDDVVHRITLVHFTKSRIGTPSSPPARTAGLEEFGRDFARRMQEKRILVDLSHINRAGFFDALEATDPTIPVAVTHTGVAAVRALWRNIDDEQIRAIAERGGTVGIIYQPHFLDDVKFRCPIGRIVDHMQHVIDLVGEDHVTLGSDYDGLIALPEGFDDITHQPKLVAVMLARGWTDTRIKKVMGHNFLRVVKAIRP
jgi:membrane dipeptidase